MFFSSAYAMAQQTHSDFQAYRDSIINEYKGFRKGLLDDYAKFLDGIWKEFEVFRGVKRNDTPKPTVVPQYKELPDAPQPHLMPAPEPQPAPRQEPTSPTVTPPGPPRPLVLPKPDAAPALTFSFHGTKLKAPNIKVQTIAARKGSALPMFDNSINGYYLQQKSTYFVKKHFVFLFFCNFFIPLRSCY